MVLILKHNFQINVNGRLGIRCWVTLYVFRERDRITAPLVRVLSLCFERSVFAARRTRAETPQWAARRARNLRSATRIRREIFHS